MRSIATLMWTIPVITLAQYMYMVFSVSQKHSGCKGAKNARGNCVLRHGLHLYSLLVTTMSFLDSATVGRPDLTGGQSHSSAWVRARAKKKTHCTTYYVTGWVGVLVWLVDRWMDGWMHWWVGGWIWFNVQWSCGVSKVTYEHFVIKAKKGPFKFLLLWSNIY
jgi:hypothetical protein